MQQVLPTLRFYATASFHQVIGDLFGLCNYAVWKVVHRVSRVIIKITISSIVMGLKNSYFPLVSHWTVCYQKAQ